MVKDNSTKMVRKFTIAFLLTPAIVLMFLSGICEALVYVASVFLVGYIFSLSPQQTMVYFVFHEFFSGFQVFFMTGIVACLLNLFIRYIVDIGLKKRKVHVKPLLLSLFMLLLYGAIHYQIDTNGILQGAIIIAVLVGLYLIFSYRDQIDEVRCTLAGLCGLLVSLTLSVIAIITHLKGVQPVAIDSKGLHRFMCLTSNPNYLAMLCVFLLSFCICNLTGNRGKLWQNLMGAMVFAVVGLLTMSKAFLISLLLILIYAVIALVIKLKKKSLWVILPGAVLLAISVLCFKDFFVLLFRRFFIYGDGSVLSKITTGRTEIWAEYISEVTSSIPKMLFGVGLFSGDLAINSPHSTLVFYLYRMGVIGMVLLVLLSLSFYECSDKSARPQFSNILPLLMFVLIGLEEVVINERFFIFLALSISMLKQKTSLVGSQSAKLSIKEQNQ